MFIKLAALGALGYVGYRYYDKHKSDNRVAFAPGQTGSENFAQVRNAGAASTATGKKDTWDSIDEESDESFPASDPPANY